MTWLKQNKLKSLMLVITFGFLFIYFIMYILYKPEIPIGNEWDYYSAVIDMFQEQGHFWTALTNITLRGDFSSELVIFSFLKLNLNISWVKLFQLFVASGNVLLLIKLFNKQLEGTLEKSIFLWFLVFMMYGSELNNLFAIGISIQYSISIFAFLLSVLILSSTKPFLFKLSFVIFLSILSFVSYPLSFIAFAILSIKGIIERSRQGFIISFVMGFLFVIGIIVLITKNSFILKTDEIWLQYITSYIANLGNGFSIGSTSNALVFGSVAIGLIILFLMQSFFRISWTNEKKKYFLIMAFPLFVLLLNLFSCNDLFSGGFSFSALIWIILFLWIIKGFRSSKFYYKHVFFFLIILIFGIAFVKTQSQTVTIKDVNVESYLSRQTVLLNGYNSGFLNSLGNEASIIKVMNRNKDFKFYENKSKLNNMVGRKLEEIGFLISDTYKVDGSFEELGAVEPKSLASPGNLPFIVSAKGWAFLPDVSITSILIIDEQNVIRGVGYYGNFQRKDVADYLHTDKAIKSGWYGLIKLDKGIKKLTAFVLLKGDSTIYPLRDAKEVKYN